MKRFSCKEATLKELSTYWNIEHCVGDDIEDNYWIQLCQPVTRSKEIGIDNGKKKVKYLPKHLVYELINLTKEHKQSWSMEYTIHRKENVPITKNKVILM